MARRGAQGLGVWALLLGVGAVIGYLAVGPAGHGPSRSLDRSIASAFTHVRPPGAVGAATVLPDGLVVVVGVVVLVLVVRAWRSRPGAAVRDLVALGIAAAGAYGLSTTLKVLFTRPRPPRSLEAIRDTGYSFPSSHTTVGGALVVTAAVVACRHVGRRWHTAVWSAALTLIAAIGMSRLVLGVHWGTDVAVGAAIGAAWGSAACRLAFRPLPLATSSPTSGTSSRSSPGPDRCPMVGSRQAAGER